VDVEDSPYLVVAPISVDLEILRITQNVVLVIDRVLGDLSKSLLFGDDASVQIGPRYDPSAAMVLGDDHGRAEEYGTVGGGMLPVCLSTTGWTARRGPELGNGFGKWH
jgi:hypothetical protein